MDAPAAIDLDPAAVPANRDGHLQHALGRRQDAQRVGIEADQRGPVLDAFEYCVPRVGSRHRAASKAVRRLNLPPVRRRPQPKRAWL